MSDETHHTASMHVTMGDVGVDFIVRYTLCPREDGALPHCSVYSCSPVSLDELVAGLKSIVEEQCQQSMRDAAGCDVLGKRAEDYP